MSSIVDIKIDEGGVLENLNVFCCDKVLYEDSQYSIRPEDVDETIKCGVCGKEYTIGIVVADERQGTYFDSSLNCSTCDHFESGKSDTDIMQRNKVCTMFSDEGESPLTDCVAESFEYHSEKGEAAELYPKNCLWCKNLKAGKGKIKCSRTKDVINDCIGRNYLCFNPNPPKFKGSKDKIFLQLESNTETRVRKKAEFIDAENNKPERLIL